jgi:hypothetical protein
MDVLSSDHWTSHLHQYQKAPFILSRLIVELSSDLPEENYFSGLIEDVQDSFTSLVLPVILILAFLLLESVARNLDSYSRFKSQAFPFAAVNKA